MKSLFRQKLILKLCRCDCSSFFIHLMLLLVMVRYNIYHIFWNFIVNRFLNEMTILYVAYNSRVFMYLYIYADTDKHLSPPNTRLIGGTFLEKIFGYCVSFSIHNLRIRNEINLLDLNFY